MRTKKTIIPVAIAILFLGLAFIPSLSAEINITKENSQTPNEGETFSDLDKTLEIGYKNEEGDVFYKKLVVTDEQLSEFNDVWTNWEQFLDDVRADEKMSWEELLNFEIITRGLLQNIKEMTYDPDSGEYLFPEFNIENFIKKYLLNKNSNAKGIFGSNMFSIGRGRAWIPFNRQGESFIGMRFLPIVVQHALGYSKVRRVTLLPPSIGVEDRLFVHNVMTFGFIGLYINFGERYLDRPAGPVLLIGQTFGIRLGEDIP